MGFRNRVKQLGARFGLWTVLAAGFSLLVTSTAWAASTTISRGYSTSEKIPLGAVVSLVKGSSDEVMAATSNDTDTLLGVAISGGDSLLAVTNGKPNQVQVTTSGIAQVLVSDINGPIFAGDHITASPVKAVGMKATGNVRIVGVAQEDLKGTRQAYKDDKGTEHMLTLGQINVMVNVAYYFKEPDKTLIPPALQNLANALAGRAVSAVPIFVSAAIFVVMLVIVVSIVYSMIRSGIVSVGRNPMSQSAIYRNVIQLSALVLVILSVGFTAIYLVLTRVG